MSRQVSGTIFIQELNKSIEWNDQDFYKLSKSLSIPPPPSKLTSRFKSKCSNRSLSSIINQKLQERQEAKKCTCSCPSFYHDHAECRQETLDKYRDEVEDRIEKKITFLFS